MPFMHFVIMGVVLTMISLLGPLNSGSGIKRILKGGIFLFAVFTLMWLVDQGKAMGVLESRIVGEGSYYEVVTTTSIPNEGTLVYAIDLDGNKGKTDILVEYPMKGYKIVLIGAKSYLLPVNTIVATDDKGETFLVSEDGEVFSVPMAPKAEGPVNPPLLSSEVMSQTGGGIRLVQWVKDIRNPPMSFPEDDIPGKGEEKALLVAEYGEERILTVIVPFYLQK